jgi:hypothetical protein
MYWETNSRVSSSLNSTLDFYAQAAAQHGSRARALSCPRARYPRARQASLLSWRSRAPRLLSSSRFSRTKLTTKTYFFIHRSLILVSVEMLCSILYFKTSWVKLHELSSIIVWYCLILSQFGIAIIFIDLLPSYYEIWKNWMKHAWYNIKLAHEFTINLAGKS